MKTDVSLHARIFMQGYEGHNPWHTVYTDKAHHQILGSHLFYRIDSRFFF